MKDRIAEREDFERTMERIIIEEKEFNLLKARQGYATAQKADEIHLNLLKQKLLNEEKKMSIMTKNSDMWDITQEAIQAYFAMAKEKEILVAVK